MAKLRVEFLKIHCKEATSGPGADEIYFAAFPTLLRKKDDGSVERRVLKGALSNIQTDVREGTVYTPTLTSGTSGVDIDTEDAQTVALALWMYEEDDGAHYKKLRLDPAVGNASVPRSDWGKIEDYIPEDPSSWLSWAKAAYKLLKKLLGNWLTDDLIGTRLVEVRVALPSQGDYRELTFKGDGGEYKFSLRVTKAS